MKINPPKAITDVDNPFKDALFGREEFAKSLTSLLRNVSDNLVVLVNAPWGEGKSTFAQMWRGSLKKDKLEVIYFDAYATDYFDDPFVSFSGEILALVDKRLSEGEGVIERRAFKKTAVEVGKRLAGLGVKIGLKAATLGAIDSAHIEELKDIGSEFASGISEIGGDVIEKKIDEYSEEKDALTKFKESLAKLAAKVREQQGFPLTIIVDELDRCRPDFAVGLLERIKHLFDVEGLAFVLLVNRKQIENYIKTVYGGHDADAYLLKFGNLFVDLPSQQPSFSLEHIKGRPDYCGILSKHYGLQECVNNFGAFMKFISLLVNHFGATLREIDKVFTVMALYYSSRPAKEITDDFLIPMLSLLKVKSPEMYLQLGAGLVSVNDFFEKTGLKKIAGNTDENTQSWITRTLQCCLMSDSEFANAITNSDRMVSPPLGQRAAFFGQSNLERRRVIPFFCSRLDRFTLQPR